MGDDPFPYPTKTIPELPPALPLDSSEQFWISQAGVDRRANLSSIVSLVPPPPPAHAVVASAPPVNPLPGQLWFDAVSTQLYIFYVDPNSSQWVVANNTGVGLPEAPIDGALYARQGSTASWRPVISARSIDAGVF